MEHLCLSHLMIDVSRLSDEYHDLLLIAARSEVSRSAKDGVQTCRFLPSLVS